MAQEKILGNQLNLTDVAQGLSGEGTLITDIVEDTTPQLGGNLDVNNFNIITADVTSGDADTINITGGAANPSGNGGDINITGGLANAAAGGTITITGGDGGTQYGGNVAIVGGQGSYTAGSATMTGADGGNTGGKAGVYGGTGTTVGAIATLKGGRVFLDSGQGAAFVIAEPAHTTAAGGRLLLTAGAGQTNSAVGGDVTLTSGIGGSGGSGYNAGNIVLTPAEGSGAGIAGIVQIGGGASVAEVHFMEASGNGTNSVALQSPSSVGTSVLWTLPQDTHINADGKFLTSDASGNLSFAAQAENNWLTANNGVNFTAPPSATGSKSIALGDGASTNSAGYGIAIGVSATVGGNQGVAIGPESTAAIRGVVIGVGASATGDEGISIGRDAESTLVNQVTIGTILDAADVTNDVAYSVKIGAGIANANKNILHLFSKGKLELYGDEAQFILPNYLTGSPPTAIPSTTIEGGMIWDAEAKQIKVYDGTSWTTAAGGGVDLGEYTVATLPLATTYPNYWALATDASGGSTRTIVRSDGTNWKVVATEGATVA